MRNLLYFTCFLLLFACQSRQPKKYSAQEQQLYKDNLEKANRGLIDKDNERIEKYITRRGWHMSQTKTGLWYEIYEQGAGDSAKVNMVAHLNYKVYLLDGTYCYSSDSSGVMQINVGHSSIESGLDQAVRLMKEGDKGRFIMPPYMAHGLIGDENKIPARSIIVYHAELIKLTDY